MQRPALPLLCLTMLLRLNFTVCRVCAAMFGGPAARRKHYRWLFDGMHQLHGTLQMR